MKYLINALFLSLILIIINLINPSIIKADIPQPVDATFYFTYNNQPYKKSIDYYLSCYGVYYRSPLEIPKRGTYTPKGNTTWYGICPQYGCEENRSFELVGAVIDYCNLKITTEEGSFIKTNIYGFPDKYCRISEDFRFGQKCIFRFEIANFTKTEGEVTFPSPSPIRIMGCWDTSWPCWDGECEQGLECFEKVPDPDHVPSPGFEESFYTNICVNPDCPQEKDCICPDQTGNEIKENKTVEDNNKKTYSYDKTLAPKSIKKENRISSFFTQIFCSIKKLFGKSC